MWNKIINWFFPDWEVVDVMVGRWEQGQGNLFIDGYELVSYTSLYSKRLNKYKLKCSGHKPKFHPKYNEAIKYLNQLEQLRHELNSTNTDNS